MITLYEKTETNFTHNGLCALDGHIITPTVTEELNGLYMLEFGYPARAPHAPDIIPERLVKCPVPDMDDQLFRIAFVKKELSGITRFTAYHVFYDLVDNFIEDTFVVNKNGQQAVTQILGATQYPHPFTASSNIPAIESARMVRLNPAEVFLNADLSNGFLARWGGEIIRDNLHIYLQTVRGSDNGVAIRDKKNLTGYTSDVDFQAVCTRIMPQGFDGLFLPEKYVDSPRINQYTKPKIRVIKFEKVKAAVGQQENAEDAIPLPQALTLLRTLAAREFSVGKIDLPRASYSVAFAPLADTEEYKNFAALETVNIGDTVTVVHEADGFEITARMTGYKYDPLARAYISVTLGNYAPKFTDIAKDIKRVETGVNQAVADANFALQSANGKNTNFYGPATPANPRPGDLWFKENGDKLELWVYETRDGVTQWYPLLTDLTQEEMKAELAEAAALVEEAKQKAEEAVAAGEAAQAAGQEALAAGQAAQSAADQAAIDAQAAVTKANQAFNDAATALNNASSAASQAAAANTTAASAYNKSVKSTAVTYAVGTSGVTAPTSGWQTTVPATVAGQFLWTRTIITLQDNSAVTSYSVAKHGDPGTSGAPGPAGAPGADGKGITSTAITYQASASGTTTPTGTWTTTIPAVSASQYLWTRTIITYSDSTTSTSYSVGMMGATGAAGAAGAAGKGISGTVITYQAGASGTTVPTGTWTTAVPSVAASQFLWTRTVITYTDNTTSTSYSVGMMGATGPTGPPGAAGTPGADAPTITMVREQYYLSTSNTTQTGGSWLDTVPTWTTGKYYWIRVAATYSNGTTTYSTPVLADGLNNSLVTALEAKTLSQTLQTTVSQHATAISLNASNITSLTTRMSTAESTLMVQAGQIAAKASQTDLNTLTGRVTTAEGTLTVQAGQIAAKASQTEVNTLTGRVTAAESAIVQNADSFSLSLSKQSRVVNELAGANILQAPWQQGTLSTSTGAESNSASYVRSGWFDVIAGKKYLLQTYEGASAYSVYSTAYLFYYREDKTFLSYTTNGSSATPFTVPSNAAYLRVRYTTTAAPSTINCYLLQTETSGGYVDLNTITSMVKLQATTDTLLITVSETKGLVGTRYKVNAWERGTINTANGLDAASTSYLRSGYIDVQPAERYISQTLAGGSVTMYYHYYGQTTAYSDFVPSGMTQYGETLNTGDYTNATIITYLGGKAVESMSITGGVTTNPYTSAGDYLTIYRIPLSGNQPPSAIQWNGMKDTSDNIVLLYTNGAWVQIGTVTAASYTLHTWNLTDAQRMGITGSANLHLAFFSIKNGTYAGIYNQNAAPFSLGLLSGLLYQLSQQGTSSAITVPANTVKMRVRVSSTADPVAYTGNVYPGTARYDYSKGETLYSALLMQRDLINLRVAKNDVINQINISTEGILIAGNKIRITGTTTIDNAVIQTAMIANLAVTTAKIADLSVSTAKIADAAINNAKIANLDAGKINTGTLSADRIAAGSITSAKLTIANGYITNAMIADATIQSAKIAALDAAKITTGTLAAARIGANSITADKLATNAIQVGLAGWTNSIRITPYDISWYSGSTLEGQLNSSGMNFYYGTRFIGMMGESYDSSNSSRRGIATHLNGEGDYCTWAYRTGTSGTYTRYLTFDPKGVVSNGAGVHLGCSLRTNGYDFYTSGNRGVYLADCGLNGVGTYPGWCGTSGGAKIVFGSNGHLYIVTGGYFYNMSDIVNR